MRTLFVLPLAAAVSLAACQGGDEVVAKDESVESVAKKVAASDIKPRPGRWESNVKIDGMDIPGMPPEAKAAMNKQMSAAQTFATCLTPEEAEKPDGGFFQAGAQDCKYDSFVMAGGRIDAVMTCKQQGANLKMTMGGTYSETEYAVKVSSTGEMQPGQTMSMDMAINSRRTGDCNGTEQK